MNDGFDDGVILMSILSSILNLALIVFVIYFVIRVIRFINEKTKLDEVRNEKIDELIKTINQNKKSE